MLQEKIPDVAGLVEPDRVRKEVYTDPALFQLEMERIHERVWIYGGHESQVKEAGDYYTVQIGRQLMILVRGSDGNVSVLYNRCPHRGNMLCGDRHGNTGEFFRNDSPRSMVKLAVDEIGRGSQLLVFPEGTRTVRPPVNRFKPGFAQRAGVPVQTVFIETNSPFLGKGWPWRRRPDSRSLTACAWADASRWTAIPGPSARCSKRISKTDCAPTVR